MIERADGAEEAEEADETERSRRNAGGLEASAGGNTSTTWATSGWEVNGRKARSTMGIPPTGRYCLAVSLPNRTPRPAATTIAPTSRGKRAHQLVYVVQPH